MIKFLICGLVAIALASCASTNLNGSIAETSSTLAKQCSTVAILIEGAQAFNHKPRIAKALKAAEAARLAFCNAPPTDEASATMTLGTVILGVEQALHS